VSIEFYRAMKSLTSSHSSIQQFISCLVGLGYICVKKLDVSLSLSFGKYLVLTECKDEHNLYLHWISLIVGDTGRVFLTNDPKFPPCLRDSPDSRLALKISHILQVWSVILPPPRPPSKRRRQNQRRKEKRRLEKMQTILD
jgi:hypothetical protein